MKYILILGLNYRDCKAKLDSIIREAGTTYTLVTKPKHVVGFESSGVLETVNAKKNPLYREIKMAIKGVKKIVQPKPVVVPPVVEIPVEEPVVEAPEEIPMIDELPVEEPIVMEELVIEEIPVEDIPEDADVMEELVIEEADIPEEVVEESVVEEEVIPEPIVEEEEVPAVVPEEEEAVIKPVDPPRGWHARAEYVDVAGNIFKKGKYVGKLVD